MSTHNICVTNEIYYTASRISCQYPFLIFFQQHRYGLNTPNMLYFPRCRSQTGDREGATCDVGCIFDERHCWCRILCDMVRHPEMVGTLAATCFSLKGKTPRCASAGSCCYICSRCIFDCFQYSTLLAHCQIISAHQQPS